MKKILVPTDFSPLSENALLYGCNLALQLDAEIHLLNIQSLPASDDANMAVELIRTVQEASEEKLKNIKADVNKILPELKLTTHFSFGIASITVKEVLSSGDYDLVVMGSMGSKGIDRLLFGSVAEAISKHSPCPVVILHEETTFQSLKNLAVAIDIEYKFRESFQAIHRIVDMAAQTQSNISWFYVKTESGNEEEDQIKFRIDNGKEIDIQIVRSDTVDKGISKFCKSSRPDMLILLKKDYNLIQQLFHHSVLSDVLQHQSLPIMVVHY